jgi:PAS domain S-box-containing protein
MTTDHKSRLEDYFLAAPCFVSVQDPLLRIIASNERFRAAFGDVGRRPCFEVYKGLEQPCGDCPVVKAFADGRQHQSRQLVRLPSGEALPVVAYASPVLDTDGRVEAVVEISADITEQVRLEEELHESREHFRLLFEEAPCFISVQDRELRVVRANRRFEEAFGPAEGARCYDLYKHRKEQCLRCAVAETFVDGATHHSEEVVTSRDGEHIYTLVSTAPISSAEGEIELVMEMSTDISRIRRLQGQLTNLGLLIGSISHGLKGLLTGLDGGTYLVKTGVEKVKPQRVEQGLQMIRRNVGQIRGVLKDLLFLAGDDELELEIAPLAGLAHAVASRTHKRAADLDIVLSVEISDEQGTCEVDVGALEESLLNIFEHALESCRLDASRQTHHIRFALRWEADDALFIVEDDGIGMDRETRERVFSLHLAAQGAGGVGLGLYTASKVIERHRGVIEVSSEHRQGTSIRIRIPRA